MVGLDEDPSRAQIVLVGALAIAFIVLGIVVVFNTSLYAENVDSTGTVSSVNQAEQVRHAGGQSVAGLAYRVNEGNFTNETDIAATMNDNTSNLSAVWQSLYARSQPSAVNASLDGSNSEYGVRVFQSTDADFRARGGTPPGTSANWTLTPTDTPATYADIGRFELTLERDSLDTDQTGAFHLSVLGSTESGDWQWRNVWFTRDGSGNVTVYLAENSSTTDPRTTSFEWYEENGMEVCDVSVGTTAEVDLVTGSIEGTNCFEFLSGIHPVSGTDGYEVQFRNGGNVSGQYEAHLSTTAFESVGTRFDNSAGDAPYYSYILWEATAIVEYGSPAASYTRTVTVPVYNSTR
ncbi:hypothetical protein [Haloarchaeobius salinus]|uniref:hypothetical protein n=1 Tax=Haloarchaeobius salinus TaxID=1198298 RepID=UPI002108981A|nr:hypothetical protein [Haloarchaeobius salinus]